MTNSTRYKQKLDHSHADRARRNNVATWSAETVRLRCGHEVIAHAVVTLAHYRWYVCPRGCGLKRGRKVTT